MYVPGIDGRKMSKSYGNGINIFAPEKELRRTILKIITDVTPLEEPKNPDVCIVFQLYSLLASENQINEMRQKYLAGNYGYGHAKIELYELILEKFKLERIAYNNYMSDPVTIENALKIGKEKAESIAINTLKRVRKTLGYV